MLNLLHKHATQFLPQEHHIPRYSVARVVMGVMGWIGLLSMVWGFFGYNIVDASSDWQEIMMGAPTKVVKKKSIKANAGADQTVTLPATSITLDGSASTGAIAKYTWKQTKWPKKLTMSNGNTSIATLTNLVKGTYVFELKVKDSRSLSSRDTVAITIKWDSNTTIKKITDKSKSTEPKPVFNYPGNTAENSANNKAPIANAGVDQILNSPINKTTLNAFRSTDSDGFIAMINWKQTSGPTTITLSAVETNMEVSTSVLSIGTYVFELSITDDKGAVSTDKVSITVK